MSEITQSHFTFVRKVTERVSDLSNDTRRQEEIALVSQPRTLPSLGLVSTISGSPLSGISYEGISVTPWGLPAAAEQRWEVRYFSDSAVCKSWAPCFSWVFPYCPPTTPQVSFPSRVEGAEVECENGLSLVWFFPILWTV